MYGFLKTIEAGLGVLSLLAYGLILGVLFRRPKEFSNAYYGIVKYGGIVDIVFYIWDWFSNRLVGVPFFMPFYRLFFQYFPWLGGFFWLNQACFHAAQAQTMLAGWQRVCLMSKPIFADVGFRTIVNYFFALLPVGVIVVSSPIAIWHQAVEVAGTEIRFDVSQSTGVIHYNVIVGSVCVLVNLFILLTSVVYLIKYRNALNAIRRLFFISFFIGVTRFAVLVLGNLSVMNDYLGWQWGPWLSEIALPLTMDLTLLSAPWLHLAFNRAIQRRLSVIFRIKEENQVQIALPIVEK